MLRVKALAHESRCFHYIWGRRCFGFHGLHPFRLTQGLMYSKENALALYWVRALDRPTTPLLHGVGVARDDAGDVGADLDLVVARPDGGWLDRVQQCLEDALGHVHVGARVGWHELVDDPHHAGLEDGVAHAVESVAEHNDRTVSRKVLRLNVAHGIVACCT